VTIGRLVLLLVAVTLGIGLSILVAGLLLVSSVLRLQVVLIGGSALAAATLAAGVTGLVLGRRLLRPFAELADSVVAQEPLALSRFLHSDVDEVVAVATAVQRTEARLTSSMAQMQRDRSDIAILFEHMADGVLVLDADDRVEMANPAATRLLRQNNLYGRPLASAVRDPDVLQVVRAARDGSPVRHPVELHSPNGHRAWVQVVATRLPTADRLLVLLQDVTELRHAETIRRDFVANVSHELKTPVASLKALVETLEAGALHDPECGPDFLRRMHVEVDGLAQLVAELLQLTRIEAGRLDLDLCTCQADELIGEAIDRIRPYASRVGLDIGTGYVEPELLLHADPRQIGQVLSNLLSNAVKFTPPGGHIELGARRDGQFVELSVSDSGVGIARHDLNRVFERFYKVDPSRTGSGTGLGLAICKHVVQAHGGTIYAESEGHGRGATFRLTLPAAVAPAPESRPQLNQHPAVRKVYQPFNTG
jgi:two-component system, OmpR family, phosphate regulon sensor histidine kinase PhoR